MTDQAIYKVLITVPGLAALAVGGQLKNVGNGWYEFLANLPFSLKDCEGTELLSVDPVAQKV